MKKFLSNILILAILHTSFVACGTKRKTTSFKDRDVYQEFLDFFGLADKDSIEKEYKDKYEGKPDGTYESKQAKEIKTKSATLKVSYEAKITIKDGNVHVDSFKMDGNFRSSPEIINDMEGKSFVIAPKQESKTFSFKSAQDNRFVAPKNPGDSTLPPHSGHHNGDVKSPEATNADPNNSKYGANPDSNGPDKLPLVDSDRRIPVKKEYKNPTDLDQEVRKAEQNYANNPDFDLPNSDEAQRRLTGQLDKKIFEHNKEISKFQREIIPELAKPKPDEDPKSPSGDDPVDFPEKDKIKRAKNYAQFVFETMGPNSKPIQRQAAALGTSAINVAENSFKENDLDAGNTALRIGVALLDFALSITPGIGVAKDAMELLTGKSIVTGAELTNFERTLAAVGIITCGLSNIATDSAKTANTIRKIVAGTADEVKAVEAIKDAEKTTDFTRNLGWGSNDISRLINAAADLERHGPMTPGRLHEVAMGNGTLADTFRSSSYFSYKSTKTLTLFRVQGKTHQSGDNLGRFWTRDMPTGPVQSILDSALDPTWGNTGTNWIKIEVPSDTVIFEGVAASQRGIVGGGNQIVIEKINNDWIKEQGKF